MGKRFTPPGVAPWQDVVLHQEDCGGLILMGERAAWYCTACGTEVELAGEALRQAERAEAAHDAAFESGLDNESWWPREYLRLWGEALKMNGTPYRAPRRVDKRQGKLELPDG